MVLMDVTEYRGLTVSQGGMDHRVGAPASRGELNDLFIIGPLSRCSSSIAVL